jgi:aryl-alcohol dehydrogenase-like predicted oxidoreductase
MEYRYLGTTGVKVSALCLGTLTFGREVEEPLAQRLIARYLDAGGNFVDTANVYARGQSEEIVGRALEGRRDDVVLASKVRQRIGEGANEVGLSRLHIMQQVELSLHRLRTDHIDLYYLHCWDPDAELEDTLRAMDDLVRAGKVRYWGISNFTGWQIALTATTCRYERLARPIALQPQYSLLVRDIERDVLPAAQRFGLAVMPWSPLARGFLSGKYRRTEGPRADARLGRSSVWLDRWERWDKERHWRILEVVQAIAQERGVSPAQVALNWLLHRPGVTAPIVGATTMAQLEDNLASATWRLSDDERARLDAVSALEPSYPYEFIDALQGER